MNPLAWKFAIVFVLTLCLAPLVLADDLHVAIDSLDGRADVQRAGRHDWQRVGADTRLFNNDILHVQGGGHATLRWPDGTVTYVHQNSQIMINLLSDDGRESQFLNHATVFFGAVFFMVKKIAPRGLFSESTLRVYTPTAVLAIRGTSFEVDVDKKGGTTRVKVISGTVEVRNILRRVSLFLAAPLQTIVSMNDDPTTPIPVLKADLESLRTWVPATIITKTIEKQIVQVKKDNATLAAKLEDKCVITLFDNASSYNGPWPISTTLTKATTTRLRKIKPDLTFVIKNADGADPFKLAAANNCRYAILGTIEEFDVSQRAEITPKADTYREYAIATVRIRMRLLDAAAVKQLAQETYSGTATSRKIKENSWKSLHKLSFNPGDTAFAATVLGEALNQALDQATEKLWRYIE